MRNQLHLNKDSKEGESEEAAALAREEAMRTIVVPGKNDIGNVLLDITYYPFQCVSCDLYSVHGCVSYGPM